MEQKAMDKLLQIEETLRSDPVYQHLVAEHKERNVRFLAMAKELDREQQDILYDYLGLLIQMHTEMLLAACEEKSPEG